MAQNNEAAASRSYICTANTALLLWCSMFQVDIQPSRHITPIQLATNRTSLTTEMNSTVKWHNIFSYPIIAHLLSGVHWTFSDCETEYIKSF